MHNTADTDRPIRNRRPSGALRATARLRPRGAWLPVTLLTIAVLLSAGAGLQQASAKSRHFLPVTTEDIDLPPSAPSQLRVVGATGTSLTLAWSPSSDDGGVVGYEVRRADARAIARVETTNYVLSSLGCGRTYDVSVVAYDAVGNRSAAAVLSAPTTPCADAAAPSSPTRLRLTYRTPTSISLSWRAASDNNRVTRYGAYVDAVLVGDATSEAFTFADLKCGRNYTLAIDAVDATGNRSAPATTMVATAACPDGTAPSSPTVVVNGATKASVSVAWRAASDNVAVVGYELWLQNRMIGRLNAKKRSYTFSGLACGSTYSTGVIAYDASGNRSSGTTLATATSACEAPAPAPPGDTTPPTAPASLTASSTTSTGITLTWPASTDDAGVTEYGVYLGANRIGTTGTTSYALSGLTCGTTYTVAVDAADAAGNRSAKRSASVATASCGDTVAPSTPTGLQLMVANETSVTVAWTASTDNVGVTGYGVYLSNLLVSSPTSPSVTLTGLTCGKPYFVEVDAKDAAGNRSTKASLWVNTKACPDTTPPSAPTGLTVSNRTQTALTLQWAASTDNVAVTGYTLRRNSTVTGTATGTSSTFSGLACGTSYTLDVTAYDAAGNRSSTSAISTQTSACPAGDTQAPTTPTGLSATGSTQTSITLGWNASTDNVGVTGYGVYNGSQGVGNTTSRSYTVSGLTCGSSYGLAVDAYDAANNRSGKAQLSASTAACATTPPPANTIAPGQSWQSAYDAAPANATLIVAAGNHGAPALTGSKAVTFLGNDGAVVSKMPGNASNVTFENIDIDTGQTHGQYNASEPRGTNITWRNVDVRGAFASVHTWNSAVGFRWIGGSLIAPGERNCSQADGQPLWLNADNATIERVTFGVFDSGTCPGDGNFHMEAIRVQGASDITLLNVTFSQGSDTGSGHVFLTTTSPSDRQPKRFRVENTVFPPLVGSYAIQIHTNVTSYDRYVYRNNRFDQGILDPAPYVGLIACGSTGSVPASWKVAC